MNVVLVMFRENGDQRSFSLSRDVTVIGRREDADFRIPLSDVSRKHCRLIKDGTLLLVEDLGSANGTYLNGTRVQDGELSPGDTLQIGPVQFLVQIDGVPHDEDLPGHHTMAGRAVPMGGVDGSLLATIPAIPPFPTSPVHKLAPNAPTVDETPSESILGGRVGDTEDDLENDLGELEEIIDEPGDLVEVSDGAGEMLLTENTINAAAQETGPDGVGQEALEEVSGEVDDEIIFEDDTDAAHDDIIIDLGESNSPSR